MNNGRVKNTIRNFTSAFFYKLVAMFLPFLARSIILHLLGEKYLGLKTLFTSIFQFLNLAEFGIGNALTFKMYQPAKEEDYENLSNYASVIYAVYKVIGCIILLAGLCVLPFLDTFITGEIPTDINIYILYLIYLINAVIPYFGSGYCSTVFAAFQRLDIANTINIAVTLGLNIVQLILLYISKNYYVYILCMPAFTIISNALMNWIKNKYYSAIDIHRRVDSKIVSETFASSAFLFGHALNYVVLSSSDNIVISAFLGLEILALYGNYYTIWSAVTGLITVIIESFMPSIGNLILDSDEFKTWHTFKLINTVSYILSGWASVCLLCLYQPFMLLWLGETMLLPTVFVMLMTGYLYVYNSRIGVSVFKDAAGIWKEDWVKPYISSILNLVLNVCLVKVIGVNGVVIATVLVVLFINMPFENYVVIKKFFPQRRNEFYMGFGKATVVMLVAMIITFALCNKIQCNSDIMKLILNAVICVAVPGVTYCVAYRKSDEFDYLKSKFVNVFNNSSNM